MSSIYHYTDLKGLKGIVRKDDICLWFSHYQFLNDYTEGEDIVHQYKKAVNIFLTEEKVPKDIAEALINYRFTNNDIFVATYHEDEDLPLTRVKVKEGIPFICCFSSQRDSLDMWRYYSQGTGCALEFEKSMIEQGIKNRKFDVSEPIIANTSLSPVLYDDKEKEKAILEFLRSKKSMIFENGVQGINPLLNLAFKNSRFLFKHSCFKSESEVRGVINCPADLDGFDGKSTYKIKYRVAHNFMVPYIKIHFDKRALRSIMVSPMASNQTVDSIKLFLNSRMLEIGVTKSSLPIRF